MKDAVFTEAVTIFRRRVRFKLLTISMPLKILRRKRLTEMPISIAKGLLLLHMYTTLKAVHILQIKASDNYIIQPLRLCIT